MTYENFPHNCQHCPYLRDLIVSLIEDKIEKLNSKIETSELKKRMTEEILQELKPKPKKLELELISNYA